MNRTERPTHKSHLASAGPGPGSGRAARAQAGRQRYTYRVLQTIQMKLIPLWVWAEWAVLGRAKTALKFKYEIQIG